MSATTPVLPITNIAAYQFAELADLKVLREELLAFCKERLLKGTILLSSEGINLFVAGGNAEILALVARLRAVSGLESLTPKVSLSELQPFSRMLVRIKKEIIAFGVEGIRPAIRTSPKLSAAELKRWLDEGRPVTLLDTRNDYEVKLGTFKNALPIGIDHFRQFPEAVQKLPEDLKTQPIVMFCTGGIRCEKAGPYMESVGFEQIYQLDGGILKYFEECGGDHYNGECFVFDQRVGVDPALQETDNTQCFACLTPLTADDQADSRYQPPHSCPYCHVSSEEQMAKTIAARHAAIATLVSPLPGSVPYENKRPIAVPEAYDGRTLIEFLTGVFDHLPAGYWAELCAAGRVQLDDGTRAIASRQIQAGERYYHVTPGHLEPAISTDIKWIYEDHAIVVVNKPAPLPVHASGRYCRNTLDFILQPVYKPQTLKFAHRLDALTTGVLVASRTRTFARRLQPQFANGQVEKTYLALVIGHPPLDEFECDRPISTEAGALGSREVTEAGLASRTLFRLIERRSDGTALLEASPLTGRTNQIRVHLWHLGWPIVGDPVYQRNCQPGEVATKTEAEVESADSQLEPLPIFMGLHAWKITFLHPDDGRRVVFEAETPAWAKRAGDDAIASSLIG
jgi:UPF0176 protein